MNTEKLYEAITLIDDNLIDEAITYTPKKKKVIHWKRWATLAACLVLVVGVGSFALKLFGGFGSSVGANAGGSGADGSSTFMSYAGPVFPLTTTDDAEGITAQRDITLDFLPWASSDWIYNKEKAAQEGQTEEDRKTLLNSFNQWTARGWKNSDTAFLGGSTNILVTDTYTLTNSTNEDVTATLLYPFASSLRYLDSRLPSLSVDGVAVDTILHAGGYSGSFTGAIGSEESGEQLNLAQLNSWEQYKALLENGAYQTDALDGYPDLSHMSVIVYEFNNAWADPGTKDAPNPSLRVSFHLDEEKTVVLSHGFHSCSRDPENDWMGQGFSIREEWERDYGEPYYLIVVGDDIRNMETGAFVTGGWDTEDSIENYGVDITRYETDLDTILRKVTALQWEEMQDWEDTMHAAGYEMYHGLFCEYLLSYGVLAEDGGVARYDTGWLFELDAEAVDRVFYLESIITIPAGASVEVTAVMSKSPSYDHYCAHTENQGVKGYDMVTQLGSTLTFSSQTASLLDHNQIEIVRQNFGFDLENGVNTVELDSAAEHYYLEVRRAAN